MAFAALIDIPANVGYVAVFALIAIETMGIPVPAETALIAAALLAHKGGMDIGTLIVIASAAAILGDNVGFAIGRHYGRRLFLARGPLLAHRRRLLEVGEPFFARHGPKAVFLGRWVSGLRIASAWLAGMNRMRWPTFVFWNALGGIAWATSVALSIYLLGSIAERAISIAGPVAAGLVVILLAGLLVWRRRQRRAVDARATSAGAEGE
ncbi:DedA family protein [Candidatus Solirubrobacter pratensis]|uniref:DedA family protein n=1 Tax=Candidatus Solirubrobacter pratensis TaxID=1298857 RepID=UPI0006855D9E|nr:DedA family protein [Candidatus Solirubrobacter pratensis]